MKVVHALAALGPADARSVVRDPLLRWLMLYPLVVALAVRAGSGAAAAWLALRFGADLTPYYPLVMSFVLLMPSMLVGMVVGFLLLDQRDDHTLAAIGVTPLTLAGYAGYRIALPLALSFAITLVALKLAGLVDLSLGANVAAAVAAAPLAPFYALFLGAFAENKVQGFALTKALGILVVPPCIAWFVAPPWQWLFGLDPLYWPARLYWELAAGRDLAGTYFVTGLAVQAVVLAVLLRRFERRGQV